MIIIEVVLMMNKCSLIFPKITNQEEQIEYITTIVQYEQNNDDRLFIEYFAKGMTEYLLRRIQDKI